ncbi:MAG: flagellar protein FliT [Methylobacter sp.]|nr:MAG: flagellar protein FliT [Methylobacter sp.]
MDFNQGTSSKDINESESILDIQTQADQLLDLTQAMLTTATADDWDAFELLEQQRSAILEMVFSSQAIDESAKLYLTTVIKEIQLIDKAITNLIIEQRDQAAKELRHLRHARESDKAYRIEADNSE